MRAAVVRSVGAAEVLRVEEVAMPQPQPHEALVKVAACGVCFHDVLARDGTLRRNMAVPFVPGHEVSGIVSAVGASVRQFKVGDRVATTNRRHICGHCHYCRTAREGACEDKINLGDGGSLNGGYAEFVCVGEDCLAPVPVEMALEDAAISSCAIGTQMNALRMSDVRLGERVLVLGAGGGLGIHGVQLARLAGAEVIAVTTSPEKAAQIEAHGAHHVVVTARAEDFSREVLRLTAGRGVDVVIDNVGSPVFSSARKSLAHFGRWVLVGQVSGEYVPFNPAQLFFRGITMLSAKNATREQLKDVLDLQKRRMIHAVTPERYVLDDSAQAHVAVESGRSFGRVLILPGKSAGT